MITLTNASASIARCIVFLLGAQLLLTSAAAAQSPQAGTKLTPALMDRQREISLALSACPPSVAATATVYALDASGYVKVRDGKDGFTAIVQH